MRIANITCAKCRKPVDEIEWMRDYSGRYTVITVRCHGEIDTMTLSDYELSQMPEALRQQLLDGEGFAFQPKLEGPAND